MSIPQFPPIPVDGHVNRIDASWFRKLKTYCEYAATHPVADNDTLECTEGTMRIRPRGRSVRGTVVDSSYVGPWAITDATIGDTKRVSVSNTGTILPDSGRGRWVGYVASWNIFKIPSLFLTLPDAAGYWVVVSSFGGVYLLSEAIVPKDFEYILGHVKDGVITQIHKSSPIIYMTAGGLVYPESCTEDGSIVYVASVPANDMYKTSAGYGSLEARLTIGRNETRYIVLRYTGSTTPMTITAEQTFPEPQRGFSYQSPNGAFIVIATVTPIGIIHHENRQFQYFAERYLVL